MKKGYFKIFSWFQYLFKSYAWLCAWYFSIDYCVKWILGHENSWENCPCFTLKWFLFNSFGEMGFKGGAINRCKNSKFWNFDSTLYLKSGSMPLRVPELFKITTCSILMAISWLCPGNTWTSIESIQFCIPFLETFIQTYASVSCTNINVNPQKLRQSKITWYCLYSIYWTYSHLWWNLRRVSTITFFFFFVILHQIPKSYLLRWYPTTSKEYYERKRKKQGIN